MTNPNQIKALNGDKLFPFQVKGVDFLDSANGRASIHDECGLGKTVQVLSWLRLNPDERLPAVAVVKATLKTQWQRQFSNWVSENDDGGFRFAQILDSAADRPLPGIPMYICSYDLIRRFARPKGPHGVEENELAEMLEKRGVKTLILDECQQIKNFQSQRSAGIREIAEKMKYIIGLSGTPIKNNAGEFYSLLHLLREDLFPTYAAYVRNDLMASYSRYGSTPKIYGLRDPQEFQRKTSSFLIRRSREEVLPDLPKVMKEPMFVDLGDSVREAYKAKYKEFKQEYNSNGGMKSIPQRGYVLGLMSELRHLTGYAKVDPCIDYCMEFLGSSESRLCIFCHHRDVSTMVEKKLNSVMQSLGLELALNLVGMDPEMRERLKDQWIASKSRILILSTLASGEGLDGLQKVAHDLVTLEREWNPANEDQVEGRFSRIGQLENAISNRIFVAVGTIDEFFAKIVEMKRQTVNEALDGQAAPWNESSILQELAEVLAINGGKPWGL